MSETLSVRLIAAEALRSFVNEHAGETDLAGDVVAYVRSAALVGELAALLSAYQIRATLTDVNRGVMTEVVRQMGKTQLRNWWLAHYQQLHAEHVEAVRAALVECGVKDTP